MVQHDVDGLAVGQGGDDAGDDEQHGPQKDEQVHEDLHAQEPPELAEAGEQGVKAAGVLSPGSPQGIQLPAAGHQRQKDVHGQHGKTQGEPPGEIAVLINLHGPLQGIGSEHQADGREIDDKVGRGGEQQAHHRYQIDVGRDLSHGGLGPLFQLRTV